MARAPFQVLVLPFRADASALQVAVFRRRDYDLWQFVSGGGERGETPAQAARREVLEEAGIPQQRSVMPLDATAMIPACWFSAWPQWPDDVLLIPEHTFAVEVGDGVITLSDEHLEFRWCDYESAMGLLRFDSNRNALWELRERLFPTPRRKRPAY